MIGTEDRDRKAAVDAVRALFPNTVKIEGAFEGGNDEGGYTGWTAIAQDGARTEIDQTTVSGRREPERWEADKAGADGKVENHLTDQLEAAYYEAHGQDGFAGDYEIKGVVVIDAVTGKVLGRRGEETTWQSFSDSYDETFDDEDLTQ